MAGLLDFFGNGFDDPKSAALMALSAGLLRRDIGGGLLGANQAFAQAQDGKLKRGLLEAQVDETRAQADERRAKIAASQANAEGMQRLLYGGGGSVGGGGGQPQASLGAGAVGGEQGPGGLIARAKAMGIPDDAIKADLLTNGGKGIAEMLFKRGTPDMQVSNGFAYDKNSLGAGFMPSLTTSTTGQTSMTRIGPDGLPVVSAPRGAMETYQGYRDADEGAKARMDPVKVWNPATGREEFQPRSTVLGNQPPRQMPQGSGAPPSQSPSNTGPITGNFVGDPAKIMEDILQIRDPKERANAMAAFQEQSKRTQGFTQGGGFAAGPSMQEQAAAAAAKVGAERSATLTADRDAARTSRTDKAGDMLDMVTRAKTLLEYGDPTASGIGALLDKGAAFVGKTTQGAQSAAALENIAGALTMSVPRMEGPQSNLDQKLYESMAGKVGDRTLPVAERKAALAEVERLQKKYAGVSQGESAAPSRNLPQPMKGMVRNGYRFKGGNPADPSSWEKQ